MDTLAIADAAADSSPDAFIGSPVTVTVQRDGAPHVGVPVVFQAPTSAVIATVMTDANGDATSLLPANGIVTVIQSSPDVLSTYIGVVPPEHITLVDYTAPQPTQTVNVTAPTDPGAIGYVFNYACGGPVAYTGPVPLPQACGSAEDVLVRAEDNTGYIGIFVAMDVPIVSQAMSITGTYMTPSSQTFTVTNSSSTNVSFGASIAGTHGLMNYRNGNITGGSGSASTTDGLVASGVNEAVVVTASFPVTTSQFSQMVTSIVPSTASFSLDLDSALLPSITTPPSYSFSGHKVLWHPTGGSQTPDATIAKILVMRGSKLWEWHIAAPYVAGELALPTLPVAAFDYNPQSGDILTIGLEQAHVPGGYDAIRPNGLSTIDDATVIGEFSFHVDPTVPSQSVTSYWGY